MKVEEMFVNKKLHRFGRSRGHYVRLIDRVGLAEGDMNDEIFLNLHSSTHFLTLNPNKLVSNVPTILNRRNLEIS